MNFLNKLKKIVLIAVLLAQVGLNYSLNCNTQITPENTVFAFDLHEVILKTDYKKAIKTGLKKLPKWTTFKLLVNPWAIKKMSKTKARYGVNGKFFDEVSKKYPEIKECEKVILDLINYQNINTQMLDIIKQLKKQGYKVYIFSNITTEALNFLKENKKDLIALFDGIQNSNEQNNFARKPNIKSYLLFKDYVNKNGDANKSIIFLDDKTKNINMANKAGFTGIKYISPEKFEENLNKLGIKF